MHNIQKTCKYSCISIRITGCVEKKYTNRTVHLVKQNLFFFLFRKDIFFHWSVSLKLLIKRWVRRVNYNSNHQNHCNFIKCAQPEMDEILKSWFCHSSNLSCKTFYCAFDSPHLKVQMVDNWILVCAICTE